MRTWRGGRKQDLLLRRDQGLWRRLRVLVRRRSYRTLIIMLVLMAIVPPLYFHSKLRRLNQVRVKKCGWIGNPPLVCAHGGDSTTAFPNTVTAYLNAVRSGVDCIEIDVSRSSDGFLFALHDRDMQRISGNNTSKVGYLSKKEIHEMDSLYQLRMNFQDQQISTIEDALLLVSHSVQRVILDVKVGPPLYERSLAESILSVAGYIVMKDGNPGVRSYLTRIEKAGVVGVYHPLIDETLMRILHGRKKKVYAWTVDDALSMENMLSEQVDGVVTSNPTLFQQIMQDVKTQCLEEGF